MSIPHLFLVGDLILAVRQRGLPPISSGIVADQEGANFNLVSLK
jgi:hypothetical protein